MPGEPQQRLPTKAITYWRVELGLRAAVAVVIALALEGVAADAGLPAWLPASAAFLLGATATTLIPKLRWRRWRYEIRENDIDLQTGLWTIRRTLVPIRRIQHVDTASGPLQGVFDLATVSFHTAAGATEIPALRRDEAEAVRARVGELARTRDDV
jgi:membrane protein YdbS with pleckstrin-like domain